MQIICIKMMHVIHTSTIGILFCCCGKRCNNKFNVMGWCLHTSDKKEFNILPHFPKFLFFIASNSITVVVTIVQAKARTYPFNPDISLNNGVRFYFEASVTSEAFRPSLSPTRPNHHENSDRETLTKTSHSTRGELQQVAVLDLTV